MSGWGSVAPRSTAVARGPGGEVRDPAERKWCSTCRRGAEDIDDPAVPLFITEGPLKADAAVSAGLCCVALLGVWSWRGTNEKGGKVALPAFESIALNSRRVVIAFDSDAFTKEGVHGAMARLGDFLAHRGAEVQYLYLPHGANGAKTGVDDYLVAHRSEEIWDLCRDELTPLPGEAVAEKEDDFADIEEEDGSDLLDEIVEYITAYCSSARTSRPMPSRCGSCIPTSSTPSPPRRVWPSPPPLSSVEKRECSKPSKPWPSVLVSPSACPGPTYSAPSVCGR